MYHHLFFQLVASGLQNDAMKEKIGELLHYENQELTRSFEMTKIARYNDISNFN